MGMTLAEKVWADHLVRKGSDGAPDLLYIDLMLMHEVTSPQAFEGSAAGRTPRHLDQLIATEDHNTPTVDIDKPNPDETSATQLTTLEKNCREFGVRLHPLGDADPGHRARVRAHARSHAARHDDCVRRFAHLHARRVRRARVRHRHV